MFLHPAVFTLDQISTPIAIGAGIATILTAIIFCFGYIKKLCWEFILSIATRKTLRRRIAILTQDLANRDARIKELESQVSTLSLKIMNCNSLREQSDAEIDVLKQKIQDFEKPKLAPEAYRILELLVNYNENSGPTRREAAEELRLTDKVFLFHFNILIDRNLVILEPPCGFMVSPYGRVKSPSPEYIWITLKGRMLLGP